MLTQLGVERVLSLDAGNALFRNAGVATPEDQKRARFVFTVMEELGTKAMAVGQRDLSSGLGFLQELAKGRSLKLLSANLTKKGQPVFDAGTVITAGGVRVGIVGLTAPGPVDPSDPEVTAGGTVDATRAALKALGPRDVTVLLAATSYADAMQLAREFKGSVDFVIQSGEFRGTQPPQRLEEGGPLLLASGQKGQSMAKLALWMGGPKAKGPFVDLTVADRDRQQLDFLDAQLKTLEERLKVAKDPAAAKQLKETMGDLRARKKELNASLNTTVAPTARSARLDWVVLDTAVADEPALKARVLEIEPTYAGAH